MFPFIHGYVGFMVHEVIIQIKLFKITQKPGPVTN